MLMSSVKNFVQFNKKDEETRTLDNTLKIQDMRVSFNIHYF